MRRSPFLSIAGLLLVCISAIPAVEDRGGERLLVFGDSLCAGSNIVDGTAADAWPALLQAGGGITIINRSRGGRSTDALTEFDAALATAGNVDGVLIALGTNDSRDLGAEMAKRAVANIGALVERARRHGVRRVIIVGPPNVNRDALVQTYPIRDARDANLRRLATAYAEYAEAHACVFVPLYGVVPAAAMTADGVHPDKSGNRIIAGFMRSRLIAAPSDVPHPFPRIHPPETPSCP